jgi:hypothetical protein
MWERSGAFTVLVEKPKEEGHVKDPGVDGRIIFKWVFEKWDRGHGLD